MSDSTMQVTPVSDDGGDLGNPFPEEAAVPTTGRKWETIFQDNGDMVEWQPGLAMEGRYIGAELIELTEEQRMNSADPDKTHAPLLVFEEEDNEHERWSTWETYQIKAERFNEGDYYSIECKRERKVKTGNMKSFRILRDANGSTAAR